MLLDSMEGSISKKINDLNEVVGRRLSAIEDQVSSLRKELSEIKSVKYTTPTISKGENTAFGQFLAKIKDATRNVDWIFDEKTLSRFMFVVVPVTVAQICNENNGDVSSLCAEGLNTLMFSILPGGKSKEWKRAVGLRHRKLRKVVVLNAIPNAQKNRFGKFEYDRGNCSAEGHLHGENSIDETARNEHRGICSNGTRKKPRDRISHPLRIWKVLNGSIKKL